MLQIVSKPSQEQMKKGDVRVPGAYVYFAPQQLTAVCQCGIGGFSGCVSFRIVSGVFLSIQAMQSPRPRRPDPAWHRWFGTTKPSVPSNLLIMLVNMPAEDYEAGPWVPLAAPLPSLGNCPPRAPTLCWSGVADLTRCDPRPGFGLPQPTKRKKTSIVFAVPTCSLVFAN